MLGECLSNTQRVFAKYPESHLQMDLCCSLYRENAQSNAGKDRANTRGVETSDGGSIKMYSAGDTDLLDPRGGDHDGVHCKYSESI